MASVNDGSRPNGVRVDSKTDIVDSVAVADDKRAAQIISSQESEHWVYPYPTDFRLSDHAIDEWKRLKVAVIGAGMAGITAGILLPAKVPGLDLTIYEKNADVGGTWFENTYPGVRCDIPAHVYQSTFSPNTQWTEEYAQGPEILAYWKSVAQKYKLYEKTRFETKVTGAYWEASEAKWKVDSENLCSGKRETQYFDFVITAIGRFNEWKLPSYPGMQDYKGVLCHSSNFDHSFDPSGQRIATIGNGASGIQITTEIRKIAAHVDHYARNPTWIAGSFSSRLPDRQDTPMYISEEQRKSFQDPQKYLEYRKNLEDNFFRGFEGQLIDSDATRDTTKQFIASMRKRLAAQPELLESLVPDFPPHCRRLTPGPGYLEALGADNLAFIQTPIDRFTRDGIVTTDGIHRPVDAVICSTGANVVYAPPFPIVAGELDLSRDWKPEGKLGWPYSYIGVGTPGFPNLGFLWGPHPSAPSGTNPHTIETSVTYLAKMLRKMSSQRIRTMTPSKAAADDFVEYCDAFFPRTNLSLKCSSWSNGGKPGARIHGHWPGSGSHLAHVRREPRWEDFEYTYDRPENRFSFFGNGQTQREQDPDSDMTPYLKLSEDNDLRDIHERWWDI